MTKLETFWLGFFVGAIISIIAMSVIYASLLGRCY